MGLKRKKSKEEILVRFFHFGVFIISILLIFVLIATQIKKKDIDLNGVDFGFAVLLGFSSVCFTWASNLKNEKNEKFYLEVSNCEIKLLYGSLLFLLGSGLKYYLFLLDKYDENLRQQSEMM